MAGIGFELKRVLLKGGVVRFISVSLAGTAIVAGPWLLSMLGIFLVQRFAGLMLSESPALFTAAIMYAYTASLIVSSGLLYVFTRQISDLIYEDKKQEASSALAAFSIATLVLSAAIAAAGVLPMRLGGIISHPLMFAASAAGLFVAVNLNWVLLSFISLLKSYMGILLVYLGGALVSLLGVLLLGGAYSTGGALLGYTLGQIFTALALYGMCFYRVRPTGLAITGFVKYLARYKFLFLAGLLYAWAMWVDKIVFWFAFGAPVDGSWFRLYDRYDTSIFFAVLTIIPSLIYFTIETETSFYPRLREFLVCLPRESYQRIQEKKHAMIQSLSSGLREQSFLQAICTVALILLAPMVGRALFAAALNVLTLRLTLAAVFFHSVFLSLMIFLFYLELYGRASLAAAAFFLLNLAASFGTYLLNATSLVGLSYLIGGIGGCAVAGVLLAGSLKSIDRTIFVRAAGA